MKNKRSSKFSSRQYMRENDFEIYYYSDTHFKSVGSHSHDYYEFYFFEEGKVQMEIGDSSYPLRQGDMIIVPPGINHRAIITDPDSPYRRFVFWISCGYLNSLTSQAKEYSYLANRALEGDHIYHFDLLTFNTVRAQLFDVLDELHTDRFGKPTKLGLEICRLLLTVSRLTYEQEEEGNPQNIENKYALISAYIDEHLEKPLRLSDIAGQFYLSKYYVAHLFRESTGLSVHQYITKKRLASVCSAIMSGTSVSDAYLSCGFTDYSAFYRAFQKEYGVSPSEYRELNRRNDQS